MSSSKRFQVSGIIFGSEKYKPNRDRAFQIKAQNNKEYNCIINKDFVTEFRDYDDITCTLIEEKTINIKSLIVQGDSSSSFRVEGRPFIDISSSKGSIIDNLHLAIFKIKDIKNKLQYAQTLYSALESNLSNSSNIFNFLNTDSSDCVKLNRSSFSDLNLTPENSKYSFKILRWWFYNICFRRLLLLGLTRGQVNKCWFHSNNVKKASNSKSRPNYNEIYNICITTPLKMIPVPNIICNFLIQYFNLHPTQIEKECGGILREFYKELDADSHTCISLTTIFKKYRNFSKYIPLFEMEYGTVVDDNMVYPWFHLEAEKYVAKRIRQLINLNKSKSKTKAMLECKYTSHEGKFPTPDQQEVIKKVINNHISVITGGAGTGKTTVIRQIYNNLIDQGESVAVCSFTGKAVYRLNMELGDIVTAETMNSMINKYKYQKDFESKEQDKEEKEKEEEDSEEEGEYSPFTKKKEFKKYDFTTLIIDEASMVTTNLMYLFLIEFNFPFDIIIVGDVNQLDPIGWGFFMQEIVKCVEVDTFTLNKNLRAERTMYKEENKKEPPPNSESELVRIYNTLINPSRILHHPMNLKSCMSDGLYIHGKGLDFIHDILLGFKSSNISCYDIVCINPFKRDDVPKIVETFQSIFFQGAKREKINGKYWYLGEKVMMLKNNSLEGVMNGQDGFITDISKTGITVKFDDKILFYSAEYKEKDEDDLTDEEDEESEVTMGEELNCRMLAHSCCCITHKLQGSESNYVIFHIPEDKYAWNKFLHRNLLYVSMSRAKISFLSVAPADKLENIAKTKRFVRCDNLSKRIRLSLF
jgi:hypothetical protein